MATLIKSRPTGPVDPYTTDETPQVTVTIGGVKATNALGPESPLEQSVETDLITQYCYDTDLLQLGDPFSVNLPDPNGQYDFVTEGLPIALNIASPQVGSGQKVQKITGVITQVTRSVDRAGGTTLNVAGADLGWFLVNCDAPIWKRLTGRTFGGLYDLFVDPTWGFKGFANGNDRNIRAKLGGNYARSVATLGDSDRPPIIQVEPGDKPADYFIQYAKLANKLVNVSYDGYLQLFKPRYDTPVAYTFYHYRGERRTQNNVKRARLTRSLASRYSKAICVGTRIIPLQQGVDPNDPNANNFRGTYTRPSDSALPAGVVGPSNAPRQLGLPFNRLVAFADPDRLNKAQATARAQWKVTRGDFDAWELEYEVRGHSQGGNFFEPDTMCEVHDEYMGLDGQFYVSAVRYDRDDAGGTRSTVKIRLPNLLAA